MKKLLMSFWYAFCGLWYCIKNERNFRIHIYAAITVLSVLHRYSLSSAQMAIIFMTIASVFVCEGFNTAIEQLANTVTDEQRQSIKICKDVSAASVLISAVMAVAVAWSILWNTEILGGLIVEIFSSPLKTMGLIIYIIAGVLFIFLPERKKKNV